MATKVSELKFQPKDSDPRNLGAILREKLPLLWRAHYMSQILSRPVYPNITLKFGISLIDWRVMITLFLVPGASANQIIEAWAADKMAVSRAVRRLLAKRLLRRGVDRYDSRRRPLYLTSRGQHLYRQAWPGAKKHYRELMTVTSPTEFDAFVKTADKLIQQANVAWDKANPSKKRIGIHSVFPAL